MAAARAALARSLKLNPMESSNRLKWSQLLFVSGDRQAAKELLLVLRGAQLTVDERNTLEELLTAINITPP
jgi:thioredoxin-like negative regulator of GroEL